ncbi:hypothetical protein MMC07_007857 [Pseudocyphellaria aurata]|nr:hypothetical protein [Pseudocyphellaria aurata]
MVKPRKGHPAKGKYALCNDSLVTSQLSLFKKVQSDFLGLNSVATLDELLQKLLSYKAWKKVVDEGITPEAAERIYAYRVRFLRMKYGSKDLKGGNSIYRLGLLPKNARKESIRKETTSLRSRGSTPKITADLDALTSCQQRTTTNSSSAIAGNKDMLNNGKIFVAQRCKPCGSELVDGIFRCSHCNYINSYLSPSQKMDKLIAKITMDKGGFGTSNEVNANSSNQTKRLIDDSATATMADASIDPAPDPVTGTG